jgi:hypothetical protein
LGQSPGDLNNDSIPDYALKLIEDKPARTSDDTDNNRYRALVIVFGSKEGKLTRAAVADKLLQCTGCGGAFYGVVAASADVKIEKGVLVVFQDHGSRNVVETTYRFRYDPQARKFFLIGLDMNDRDRASGETTVESTNYLTGVKITTQGKPKAKDRTSRKNVPKEKIDLERVDSEQ